jgi:hypothetical protein
MAFVMDWKVMLIVVAIVHDVYKGCLVGLLMTANMDWSAFQHPHLLTVLECAPMR